MKTLKMAATHIMLALGAVVYLSACSEGLLSNLDPEASVSETESLLLESTGCTGEGAGHEGPFMMHGEMDMPPCDGEWRERLPECATVTESGEGYPKTIEIVFAEGCQGPHGRTMTGRVSIVETGDMKLKGSKRTVSFEHQGEDGFGVTGTRVVENLGQNSAGNYVYKHSLSEKGTGPKGDFERESDGELEWLEGYDTEDCLDNVVSITGGGTTTRDSEAMGTRTIVKPIVRSRSCKYPLSGVVTMKGPKGEVTIDFGDGSCDSKATITKDGETKEVDLDQLREKRKGRGKHRPRKRG
ncbi:MAG: hypothetical protein HYZ16_03745 [Bacteroidetes bacterium]|nr:hypothetical protein [Bacteroidota bacterium]